MPLSSAPVLLRLLLFLAISSNVSATCCLEHDPPNVPNLDCPKFQWTDQEGFLGTSYHYTQSYPRCCYTPALSSDNCSNDYDTYYEDYASAPADSICHIDSTNHQGNGHFVCVGNSYDPPVSGNDVLSAQDHGAAAIVKQHRPAGTKPGDVKGKPGKPKDTNAKDTKAKDTNAKDLKAQASKASDKKVTEAKPVRQHARDLKL